MALVRAAVTTLTHGPLRATTNYWSRPIRSTLSRSKSRLTRSLMRSPTRKGTINSVVGVLGAGSDSLRYTLPVDLDGLYDVSVRVKARVQINEFANISGNLHITEDGGLGLNTEIPEAVHNYKHAHEGVFNFIRKGLAISPGANIIDFTALVTGNNPPDVHFIDVMNMTITPTPATPTPPTVWWTVAAYASHGDVTIAGWRDYDFIQLFYAVGGNTYMTPPVEHRPANRLYVFDCSDRAKRRMDALHRRSRRRRNQRLLSPPVRKHHSSSDRDQHHDRDCMAELT